MYHLPFIINHLLLTRLFIIHYLFVYHLWNFIIYYLLFVFEGFRV